MPRLRDAELLRPQYVILTVIAFDGGATTVQINPNPTDLDASVTVAIRGSAGTVLPWLVAETWDVK
jgi:NAD-dependent SIR2 family protein deacetylase